MTSLQNEFAAFISATEEYSDTSLRSSRYHYPLVDMMRKINGDGSTVFNPEKLKEQGIYPREFRKAWAIGFARETLKYYDNHFTSDVVVKRCETCLKTDDNYDFGNLLPRSLKIKLEAKLMKNEPYGRQADAPAPNIA